MIKKTQPPRQRDGWNGSRRRACNAALVFTAVTATAEAEPETQVGIKSIRNFWDIKNYSGVCVPFQQVAAHDCFQVLTQTPAD